MIKNKLNDLLDKFGNITLVLLLTYYLKWSTINKMNKYQFIMLQYSQ